MGIERRQRPLLLRHAEAAERAPLVLAHPPAPARLAREGVGERADRRRPLAERQRVQIALAQPGVREPALAVEVHEQRHVVDRPLAAHHRLVVGDDEADRAQERREHGVELEAVAAAPVAQQPRGERLFVERRGLAQLHGEVLVGHALQVGPVDQVQPVDVRRRRTIQSDPGQQPLDHGRPMLAAAGRRGRSSRARRRSPSSTSGRSGCASGRRRRTRQDSRSQAFKRSNSPAQIAACTAATIRPSAPSIPSARGTSRLSPSPARASGRRAARRRRSRPPRRPRAAARCWRTRARGSRRAAARARASSASVASGAPSQAPVRCSPPRSGSKVLAKST